MLHYAADSANTNTSSAHAELTKLDKANRPQARRATQHNLNSAGTATDPDADGRRDAVEKEKEKERVDEQLDREEKKAASTLSAILTDLPQESVLKMLSAVNHDKQLALHRAVASGNDEAIRVIWAKRMDVEAPNKAVLAQNEESGDNIMHLFATHHSTPDALAPTLFAKKKGMPREDLVTLLSARNRNEHIPWGLAFTKGHSAVAQAIWEQMQELGMFANLGSGAGGADLLLNAVENKRVRHLRLPIP